MEVLLSNGYTTLVDEEDWIGKNLFLLPWYAARHQGGRVYVVAKVRDRLTGKLHVLRLHREVMKPPPHLDVDHHEGIGMDNRRANLRVCTDAQNQQNTGSRRGSSRFKGVSWNARNGMWLVRISANGKELYGGYFSDEAEAARRYNDLALRHHGEFARLNEV